MQLCNVVKEAVMGSAEYKPPVEASQLMADFYALGIMAFGPRYVESIHQQELDREFKAIEATLLPYLRDHVLLMVGYSICSELRHVFDTTTCSDDYMAYCEKTGRIDKLDRGQCLIDAGVPEHIVNLLKTGDLQRDNLMTQFQSPDELANTVRAGIDLFPSGTSNDDDDEESDDDYYQHHRYDYLDHDDEWNDYDQDNDENEDENYDELQNIFNSVDESEIRHDPKSFIGQLLPDVAKLSADQFAGYYFNWDESYGGEVWAIACAVWLKLYHSHSLGDMYVYIDKIYDLQHNTGQILDKNPEYGGNWLTKLLNIKLNAQTPEEIVKFGSGYMRKFCRYLLHARYGRGWNQEHNMASNSLKLGYTERIWEAVGQALQQIPGFERVDYGNYYGIVQAGTPHNQPALVLLTIGNYNITAATNTAEEKERSWPIRTPIPTIIQGIKELLSFVLATYENYKNK